ncbi:MAG: hypothetical protein JSV86_09320 [Gemmatimonadota bacterium]|nr:MAG: hypothetical protein JSV86_09320 [Gemmatimonadota bacterium]
MSMWFKLRSNESGMALLAVLLAMALLTAIGAALTAVGIVEFRAAKNHRSASRALLLADAGATHALALMRGPLSGYTYSEVLVGSDGIPDTEDDGVFTGFELAGDEALPDTGIMLGEGRYYVRIVNDDGDPSGDPYSDTNNRFVALCRGELPDGGAAEVRVMLAAPSFPAIATNGTLYLPGNPGIVGGCAGVHANRIMTVSGHPTVAGDVTYYEDAVVSGTIYGTSGEEKEPKPGPWVDIPEYEPFDYCDDAEYFLKNNKLITVGPPESEITLGKALGWQFNASTWTYELNGKEAVGGKYCVRGNARVVGNLGEPGNPLEITIIATGSIQIGGVPIIEPANSDDILLLAGGDVQIGGTTTGLRSPYYAGLIYAGSQCQVGGTPYVDGHIMCYDDPDPVGAVDLFDENKINGTPTVSYDCSGEQRRTLMASWWESRTTS